MAAFWSPFRLLFVDFRPLGCLLSSLWLPCWARCSLHGPLNIGFEIYGFGFLSFWLPFCPLFGCFLSISVLLAAFCLLFWLPCWARCSLHGPLNIGFEIYGFRFPSFWLPFWSLFRLLFVDFRPFGCLLSSLLAALLGPLLPPRSLKYWF